MPISKVTVGDVQSAGLLHPVLYVAEPQHEVDRGGEEDDEERDEKGEEED